MTTHPFAAAVLAAAVAASSLTSSGPYVKAPPEPFDTAVVLLALAPLDGRPEIAAMRTRGRAFLVSLQQEDFKATGDYEARIKVFQECTVTDILKDNGSVAGAFGFA